MWSSVDARAIKMEKRLKDLHCDESVGRGCQLKYRGATDNVSARGERRRKGMHG